MKRKTSFIMATIFLLIMLVPFHVFADTGPKPSVNIKVEGYEGKAFYITLFSAHRSPFGIQRRRRIRKVS